MFIVFGVFVHAPLLGTDPTSHMNWTANAVNLSLIGAAWAIVDAIRAFSPQPAGRSIWARWTASKPPS
jgi:hypothetical protein